MEREQTTIRLTLRLPDELNDLIRKEAVRRGTAVNQTMLYMIHCHSAYQKSELRRTGIHNP